MKAIFITGTDTGVGKTAISASLAAFLSLKKELNVGVMKPFESGLSKTGEDGPACDARFLKEASGTSDSLDEISPYTFEAPLAPEAAAKLENIVIDIDMVNRTFQRLRERHDVLVVEGAGGVLVPISKGFFFCDLIKAWDIPVIIVSRLGLGTINHTLLTNVFLQSMGISVLGVILNDTEGVNDIAAKTNPEMLQQYLNVPILGIFPHLEEHTRETMKREFLADTFADHIDTETIMRLHKSKIVHNRRHITNALPSTGNSYFSVFIDVSILSMLGLYCLDALSCPATIS